MLKGHKGLFTGVHCARGTYSPLIRRLSTVKAQTLCSSIQNTPPRNPLCSDTLHWTCGPVVAYRLCWMVSWCIQANGFNSCVRIVSKNSQGNTDPNCIDPGFFKLDRNPIPNQEIWFVNRIGDLGSRTSASLAVCMVLNKMNNCSNLHYWDESPTTILSYLFLKAVKEYVVRKYEHSSFYSEHMLQIPIGNGL